MTATNRNCTNIEKCNKRRTIIHKNIFVVTSHDSKIMEQSTISHDLLNANESNGVNSDRKSERRGEAHFSIFKKEDNYPTIRTKYQ